MNNERMHVFGWEDEPAEERPSEFPTTSGYSVHSGFYTPHDLSRRMARRRREAGLGRVAAVAASLLGLSAWAIHALGDLLRR